MTESVTILRFTALSIDGVLAIIRNDMVVAVRKRPRHEGEEQFGSEIVLANGYVLSVDEPPQEVVDRMMKEPA